MAKKSEPTKTKSLRIKLDPAAQKTIREFKDKDPAEITIGAIQTSFHANEREANPQTYRGSFPIVAIGASAGGVEACSELLGHLPADLGMAVVVITHLSSQHDSLLPSILARVSRLEVFRAESGMTVEINKVYVIPPNVNMGIIDGVIKLLPRLERPGKHLPIDFFFRCLSDDQLHFAIGIVLSGGDGDGAQGLRAIRAQGGLTFVQDPRTAKVDSMPKSAIAAGGTDSVLPIVDIARELQRISVHPLTLRDVAKNASEIDLNQVFKLLKRRTGVDFSRYKKGTVLRRLRRRVLIHKVASVRDYLSLLNEQPEEVQNLFNDFLINVTSFFRDAEMFEHLQQQVFPHLLKRKAKEGPIRVWIPGCATGEEVYSLAIVILESMEKSGLVCPIQIFASDISEYALEKAREATYPDTVVIDVNPERLRKFFVKVSGGYRVASEVRELCVFAKHDVTRDPPFSRMDLVSCRNLLIYLESSQQQRVISLFAYSLLPQRFLVLGTSETTGSNEAFESTSKHQKIFVRRAVAAHTPLEFSPFETARVAPAKLPAARTDQGQTDLELRVNAFLLERFCPSGVVVTKNMQIVRFKGDTSPYLAPAAGEATLNLFKMARLGLEPELRILLKKAEKIQRVIRKEDVRLQNRRDTIAIEVIPILIEEESPYYLVIFDNQRASRPSQPKSKAVTESGSPRSTANLRLMREELVSTREHLQAIIREQDLTNEEIQAANEEILSSNEELQSTNEELETAKEELQSSNEELSTVNDELSNRNLQLTKANNDFSNLLLSVSLPIVMVGADLRIRRFTPLAEQLFNIIPSDLGRPITNLKPNLDIPDLEQLLNETIQSVRTVEREVQDRSGHWYSLRVRPYRTSDNQMDGAVLILVDIDGIKRSDRRLTDAYSFNDSVIDAINQPVFFLDAQLRIYRANRASLQCFQVREDQLIGVALFDSCGGIWNQPMLKALLVDVFSKNAPINRYRIDANIEGIGPKSFLFNAKRVALDGGAAVFVILDEV